MRSYYIYMLEIEGPHAEKRVYIGKTYQLEKRLQDHLGGNCKSAEALKQHTIKAIKEIHKIKGLEGLESLAELDAITSRIENKSITDKMNGDGGNKAKYRGGCYLYKWDDDTFDLLNLNHKNYEELKKYPLEKVNKTEYLVTGKNKHQIVKDIMKDIH
ncbi:GIY-YIG nuclease family protein [Isobaculum melis]|uniref:GIY-YIG catalytic domain-containing protein n=1 Tax=Isobaculum melis TaxID=142588 RepID=A0A1H9PSC7_9LACT|nr:GIY-YIG nuclease family protein [Isobaculum melis]SER50705.1 GIY-YIG catalytic domain-containing protein [Isobaculum melis]